MRILLDTHAFLWYALDQLNEFGKQSQAALRADDVKLLLSPISIAEIAVKATSDKPSLSISEKDIRAAIFDMDADILPPTAAHMLALFALPKYHKDPFDRMLIATALAEDIAFMSRDSLVTKYKRVGLRVIW